MYNLDDPPPRYPWDQHLTSERNHVAALFHLLSIIFTSSALFKMSWFRIWGNHCTSPLALYQFMKLGYFESSGRPTSLDLPKLEVTTSSIVIEYHTDNDVMYCITPDVLNLMRVLIMLCVLCIFYSMIGFCLDVIGPTKKSLRFIRRNSLPSIWAVLTVVAIVGVCYLITRSLEHAVRNMNSTYGIHITYEYGCYAITAAGALSLLATTCNLLQEPSAPRPIPDGAVRQRLVGDFEDLEAMSVNLRNMPPPPPYSP
ncbi:transmembrane protein 127-like [Rhodnius prolixus]|uniref:Transmembrane protein 127 transmembrane region domain-containing protein n=2 Tax=Rhodnius TaxID=13248 RepID=R4G2T3_RHOPR